MNGWPPPPIMRHADGMDDHDGIGVSAEDIPEILWQEYVHAIEVARALHNPADDWEQFRETLWNYLIRVFAVDLEDNTWPDEFPTSSEVPDQALRKGGAGIADWMRAQAEAQKGNEAEGP